MASIKIIEPKEGDVLNRHDGDETSECLTITVHGTASGPVTVNGVQAKRSGDSFTCEVPISKFHTTITATSNEGTDTVRVLWNNGSRKRFRFSIDDNIQFLKDLGLHAEDYASLFDHWYLAFWREMHREYGSKVHMNNK